MREEDRWDEPHCVKEVKKAAGYYITQGYMLVCCLILFGGMVCPFFIPWAFRRIDYIAEEERVKKNPDPRFTGDTTPVKWAAAFLMIVWCILSWACLIFCLNNNGQDIFSTYNPKTYTPH